MLEWDFFLFASCSILLITASMSFCCLAQVEDVGYEYHTVHIEDGGEDVKVYVVGLEGLDGRGVSNLSRVVEGALYTSRGPREDTSLGNMIRWHSDYPFMLYAVDINVSIGVITEWGDYEDVVRSDSGVIVVNAHGETLAVPSAYTKEEWVDEIANAMAHRNVTWVHLAGYPLNYSHHQDFGEELWGEDGLKRLMDHIGKNNVTCRFSPTSENELCDMQGYAEQAFGLNGWDTKAHQAAVGNYLKGSDFDDLCAMPIYRLRGYDYDNWLSGVVIKFAKASETNGFGFYVHFGIGQTYDAYELEVDRDFYGSYVATAAAIYVHRSRTASENTIRKAQAAIDKAQGEGRIVGLGKAKNLLDEAEDAYASHYYWKATQMAYEAKETANEAQSFIEVYAPHLVIFGVVSLVAIATIVLLVRKKRNAEK